MKNAIEENRFVNRMNRQLDHPVKTIFEWIVIIALWLWVGHVVYLTVTE